MSHNRYSAKHLEKKIHGDTRKSIEEMRKSRNEENSKKIRNEVENVVKTVSINSENKAHQTKVSP